MSSNLDRPARIGALKSVIREIPDYPKPGISFKDITTLIKDGSLFQTSIDLLAEEMGPYEPQSVVSVEARGFIVGAALALQLGCGLVLVRKPGKLPFTTEQVTYDLEYGTDTLEMHTDAVLPGERVIIADDVLATGGTVEATKQLIETVGGEVTAACFIMELAFLEGRARVGDVPVHSLVVY